MGCDIHFTVERKYGDRWIGIFTTNVNFRPGLWLYGKERDHHVDAGQYSFNLKSRNYDFFARLAGVRGEGPEPKGIPDDASELTKIGVEGWDADGHSHSWDTLEDFLIAYIRSDGDTSVVDTVKKKLTNKLTKTFEKLTGLYLDEHNEDNLEDYRVCYFFDN